MSVDSPDSTRLTSGTRLLAGQRWLVVGALGMLGQDLVAAARGAGAEVTAVDRPTPEVPGVDITDFASCRDAVRGYDVVANCAAWTAVDAAETQEAAAFAVNAVGPANLARACALVDALLVQISTDYVLAGDATAPISENDVVAPKSAYGRTKAAGEWAVMANTDRHLIVRTAWLYGAGGPNFPKTMARLGKERDTVTVVADQQGQPTWTKDLADLIARLVAARAPSGTYHGTSSGAVTWHGFAQAVMAEAGLATRVEPITSDQFEANQFAADPSKVVAPRPAYSVLGHDALRAIGVEPIGDWRERWHAAAAEVLGLTGIG